FRLLGLPAPVERPYFLLRRGPFVIAAGMDEFSGADGSDEDGVLLRLKGRFVDLFSHELRVMREVALKPGERLFLLDLDRKLANEANSPCVVASASRIEDVELSEWALRFRSEAP